MPLSSRRDMSVSISPWCFWRCAHRGGGGREEIEGCAIFLSTIAYPQLCTLSHRSSNVWGKVWRMGGWYLDASTRKQGDGWLAERPALLPLPFCWVSPTLLCSHLYLSAVQWLISPRFAGAIRLLLSQYHFILHPSGPQDWTHRAELHLMCYVNTFCIRNGSALKFWSSNRQFSKTHLISSEVSRSTFLNGKPQIVLLVKAFVILRSVFVCCSWRLNLNLNDLVYVIMSRHTVIFLCG